MYRFSLYWDTIRYMKPEQIFYRLRKILKLPCTFGIVPESKHGEISVVQTIEELDFDPVFLARFPVEELMEDKITLLHETEIFQWNAVWSFPNHTPLWNYNLHYFEYLFSLIKAYKDEGDRKYLEKCRRIILAWIRYNPRDNGGVGWEPYPTALRLTNWLAVYTYLYAEITKDADFNEVFVHSVWEQYDCLARHLEKDLLGNHFFEDLKALILCALFFNDDAMLRKSLVEFHRQCSEQILADGMHFELSPMYHKIIFEDVMRVAVALRGSGNQDEEIESYLQSMLDAAYSFEEGLDRLPLFNDCGNNVAKSLDAICKAAKEHFNLIPVYKDQFPDSGYYIFKQGEWKLIVDAGKPGPAYIPGHAHCDAMSFELFKSGKPVIVNCGTYAYQCEERVFFRSTEAHNTVMADNEEQSRCWGAFRMGKRASIEKVLLGANDIKICMKNQFGHQIKRRIQLGKGRLLISDVACHRRLKTYFHFVHMDDEVTIDARGEHTEHTEPFEKSFEVLYAPEFGIKEYITAMEISADEKTVVSINFN